MGERITVVTENRNLRTLPFIPADDQLTTGNHWEEWLEEIEREFRYFKITDPADRKDALIIYGGKEISRLEKSIPDPDDVRLDPYEKLKTKLNEYYAPKKNKHYARYMFLKMRPTHGESTTSYAARLREKAWDCEFQDADDRLLEYIIQTTENQSLIKKTINRKWSLGEMLREAHTLEDVSLQIQGMRYEETRDVARINGGNDRKYHGNRSERKNDRWKKNCSFCGKSHSFDNREECPAYGKQCSKCKKSNHFAVVCKSESPNDRTEYRQMERHSYKKRYTKKRYGRDVRTMSERNSDDESTGTSGSSDNEFYEGTANHLHSVRKVQINKLSNYEKTVPVMLNDVHVRVEPDSGADVNLMDEYQYRAYKHRTMERTKLHKSNTKINTLQNKLPVKGEFYTIVRNKTRGINTKFIVVEGRINSPPLLGNKTLVELGMLRIKPDGSLKDRNDVSTTCNFVQSELEINCDVDEHSTLDKQQRKRKKRHRSRTSTMARVNTRETRPITRTMSDERRLQSSRDRDKKREINWHDHVVIGYQQRNDPDYETYVENRHNDGVYRWKEENNHRSIRRRRESNRHIEDSCIENATLPCAESKRALLLRHCQERKHVGLEEWSYSTTPETKEDTSICHPCVEDRHRQNAEDSHDGDATKLRISEAEIIPFEIDAHQRYTQNKEKNMQFDDGYSDSHIRFVEHTDTYQQQRVPDKMEDEITCRDQRYKLKCEKQNERPRCSNHTIKVGDHVLFKQHKKNKWSTAYETTPYVVVRVDGSSIAARRTTDGREVYI